ncbi:MAG: isoprenylcysteine carboxylmethyltransferase family protein [Deltaproteobacteria bacterium]|nr:isoprenylcysteine carboxylmethyltransferase family protein [Deltaproteobacteria bacterium]
MTAASTTLMILVAYGALAFGWRSWLQWRRTGSTGFRGLSGRVGSSEWNGGALLIVALALAVAAPLVVVAGVLDPWPAPVEVTAVGGALLAVGFVGTLAAQLSMGDSWRIGVDASERTDLVARGLFRVSRNPIFTSMLVFLAGLALVLPTIVSALACAVAVIGLEIQVRLVEEPYLTKTHGDGYLRYAAQVGRFLPLLGRLRGGP